MELFFSVCIISLMVLSAYFLYSQYKIYREQKALINRESKALRILREKNLAGLRNRFRMSQEKIKA